MTVKVKICGLTNLEDALIAVEAGADYLGFIFYPPSKRSITVEAAQAITAHLRTLPHCPVLVGVFVNETAVQMAQILSQCQLDLAQLSGEETPYLVGDNKSEIFGRAFKALRPTSFEEAEADAEWFIPPQLHPDQPALLLDTYHPTLRGGSGEVGDWQMSAKLAESVQKLMLAGGLTAENVGEAVAQVRPFAVDVASGVEARAGKKDPAKVKAFVRNAKQNHKISA